MQGLVNTVDIYNRAQAADDSVGGSVRSDVPRYLGVSARISNQRPPEALRAQGITLPQVVEIILYPDSYGAVQAEDIVVPRDGPWANQRLRVTGVQRSSLAVGDPRSHIQLTAVREQYAPGVP